MQARLIELHLQRGRLRERIAMQRTTLAQQLAPIHGRFALPQRLARLVQDGKAVVQRHPLIATAAAAAIVLLKPRFVLRWAKRGVMAWRTWRTVSGLLPAFAVNQYRAGQ